VRGYLIYRSGGNDTKLERWPAEGGRETLAGSRGCVGAGVCRTFWLAWLFQNSFWHWGRLAAAYAVPAGRE
jgi:hypothetical protein